MKLKHRISINVTKPDGKKQNVLMGGDRTIRSRLLQFLLGEKMNVLVISPGESVCEIAIREIPGERNLKE